MPIVTYVGKYPIPVNHRQWLPGERRELSDKQAAQLQAQYPGLFSVPALKKAAKTSKRVAVERAAETPMPESSETTTMTGIYVAPAFDDSGGISDAEKEAPA
jgi:hypothetical protein